MLFDSEGNMISRYIPGRLPEMSAEQQAKRKRVSELMECVIISCSGIRGEGRIHCQTHQDEEDARCR